MLVDCGSAQYPGQPASEKRRPSVADTRDYVAVVLVHATHHVLT